MNASILFLGKNNILKYHNYYPSFSNSIKIYSQQILKKFNISEKISNNYYDNLLRKFQKQKITFENKITSKIIFFYFSLK